MERKLLSTTALLFACSLVAQQPCDSLLACFQSGGQNSVITFYNCSTDAGVDVNYFWSFGDGTYSDALTPVHTYPGPGQYTACLTITAINMPDSCQNTICQVISVDGGGNPCDQLNPDFSASAIGNVVSFDNALSSNDYTYYWSFGDGTYGDGADPQHTYSGTGAYSVCLTMWAWNDQTQDTCFADHCEWVTVLGGGDPCDSLYACFQWGAQNNVVSFSDCSLGGGLTANYLWDFGDGTYSDDFNPVHTFPGPGTYNVCLTLSLPNSPDSCSNTICNEVVLGGGSPCDNAQLVFTALNQGGGIVVFSGSAEPAAGAYQWFFGDGSNSGGGLNTQHQYDQPGEYNVCLVGWYWDENAQDSCAAEWCQWVVVADGQPCDSLNACFQSGGQNSVITFYNCSADAGIDVNYFWSFGDGTYSDALNPVHTYPGPGQYTVCLTVTAINMPDSCQNTICQVLSVDGGGNPCDQLNPGFSASTMGNMAMFDNALSSNDYTYYWSFGDGTYGDGADPQHNYPGPGTYHACLTMWAWNDQTQDTCFADHCEWVTVLGGGGPCDSLLACFQSGGQNSVITFYNCSADAGIDVNYFWSFGDGTFSDALNPVHTYPGPGQYTVCLTISAINMPDSCENTTCQVLSVDGGGNPCDQLNPGFSASTMGNMAMFDNALSSNDYTYYWSFGDGTYGYGADPQHNYPGPGTYHACLTMWAWNDQTQDTCFADHCEWVTVQGGGGNICDSLLNASFESSTNATNVGTFWNTSQGPGVQMITLWNFGDGSPWADGMQITHTFPEPGDYVVCMHVMAWVIGTQDSCDATICDTVAIGIDGVNELDAPSTKLWPQPFESVLHVENRDMQGWVMFSLLDVTGRLVDERRMNVNGSATLDYAGLPPGQYVLRARNEQLDSVVRIMKR